ncbi:hypothetical protein M2165_004802 [Variovorax sp. TBS-050B]|uniref:hypothetical protein n=1 Tax=Variovorax sp. TBS-050B TaxID=2940551 RepID=UPI002477294D|nr:hypothetical protein [Variovorax sp. TBS-050B]MDH6594913.1 hypothetical protein [Variovorax sp. TBS-050B]
MSDRELPPDSEFDLRVRAELSLAFEPGEPPDSLLRQRPALWSRRGFQRGLAAVLLTGGGSGAVMALRPPALVRDAIEHEYDERALRGNFMDPRPLLSRLGRTGAAAALPGIPQLMRPCDLGGRLAYHLTTFFERGGMVTVFAFDQPVDLREGGGWWNRAYWQVVRASNGAPLVLVAQKKTALAVATAALLGPAPPGG